MILYVYNAIWLQNKIKTVFVFAPNASLNVFEIKQRINWVGMLNSGNFLCNLMSRQ